MNVRYDRCYIIDIEPRRVFFQMMTAFLSRIFVRFGSKNYVNKKSYHSFSGTKNDQQRYNEDVYCRHDEGEN